MLENIAEISLEASFAFLIVIIAVKIYKAKIDTFSKCCKGDLEIETHNEGAQSLPL
jgi:uncharacterized protein (UPF0333 family)